MKNEIVRKSNNLIEAKYSLPLSCQNFLCYCASKINKENDEAFYTVEVHANDLNHITDNTNNYRDVF